MGKNQRIAVVTGSSKGIGRGIALSLARAGYDICVHYNTSRKSAEDVANEIRKMGREAILCKADISKVEEIRVLFEQIFEKFDHIDVLVNNAGITRMAPFLETPLELFEEVINTDLKGAFFCAQFAARSMKEKGIKGVIVNITSNHSIGCWPNSTVYAAAKAGLDKLTKNMAMELSKYGIRVVAVAPGYTQLEWFTDKQIQQYVVPTSSKIPMKRFATPEEIGDAVAFLVSEKASYITGTTLFIDGGALLPVVAHNEFSI